MLMKLKMMLVTGAVLLAGVGVPMVGIVVQAEPAWAATCALDSQGNKVDPNCVETNILDNSQGIDGLLKLVVNILLYGLGAAATLGVVIAGILYLTARDNAQQVARAKMRLIEIAIGLAAWAMMYGLLRFLVPKFVI